ncbi:fatty acid desaturase [Novosphingobium sp. AAP93]|uniref:fatty acid desaturase n=1 Tax=Novosphingobium sp. AAP93 TaxID=1523427 RepID=UPI0006B9F579|nr:fatty acid desaturase [Novosphingobium sp. AAP93]KPF90136.1 fatty acid desaturase [Novosphingobium sp. AAP93]
MTVTARKAPALSEPEPALATRIDPRLLARDLQAFRDPSPVRSAWELAITLVPFVALFAAIAVAVKAGYWLALAATPLAGLFLLRLFIIQHDCGHGAFLRSRAGNDWIGRLLGAFTLTPYDCWRYSHAQHHAGTGNLEARGSGDVDMLTVREFRELSWLRRLGYRLYRHPAVLLGLGPAYLFLLRHRLPIGLMTAGWVYWVSALGTNLVTALLFALPLYVFGFGVTALVFLPIVLSAASLGVWLFYVQHQFRDAYWEQRGDWSFFEAALEGSSYLELPRILAWFTGHIGIHHVHHLSSQIPFYRLPEVLEQHPVLRELNRFNVVQACGTLRLALWDEERRGMVTFREAARLA